MMNLSNINNDLIKKCNETGNRYFDSIDYEGVRLLKSLINNLPEEAVLIGANLVNAYQRHDESEPDGLIEVTPKSYIHYTLNNYIVYIEFGHFWIFEGVSINAYPIKNGTYKTNKYPLSFKINNDFDLVNLVKLASDPEEINKTMETIKLNHRNGKPDKDNILYVNRIRKIETQFYIG